MARSTYIYVVANDSKSDEVYGLFTVKHEAITFMKRASDLLPDWRRGFCLLRAEDGQPFNPVEIDLKTIT
jgi:hypothetical protein